MNGFAFKAENAARIGVPIIPLFVLSLLAVSLVAVADVPNTLGSDDSTAPTRAGDWAQEGFDSGHTLRSIDLRPNSAPRMSGTWLSFGSRPSAHFFVDRW